MPEACPVCTSGVSTFYESIDGYDYLRCAACNSLHITNEVLAGMDTGKSTRVYDEAYWQDELRAARARASGPALVRAAEAILYATRPVCSFLDVGTGPGYLLDELTRQFPDRSDMFHGIELFPPEEHSTHPNYQIGEVGDVNLKFDAGTCIEVIEHLTPRMLSRLATGLAEASYPGSLWLFNTGMPDYVLNEDRGYLDPLHRGHVVSYSLEGLRCIFGPLGFRISSIPGKSYAFLAEHRPVDEAMDLARRIYQPVPENRLLLERSGLLFQAAFESARASHYQAESLARTKWALELQRELGIFGALYAIPRRIKRGISKAFHRAT